jgi:hypothetical protein
MEPINVQRTNALLVLPDMSFAAEPGEIIRYYHPRGYLGEVRFFYFQPDLIVLDRSDYNVL